VRERKLRKSKATFAKTSPERKTLYKKFSVPSKKVCRVFGKNSLQGKEGKDAQLEARKNLRD